MPKAPKERVMVIDPENIGMLAAGAMRGIEARDRVRFASDKMNVFDMSPFEHGVLNAALRMSDLGGRGRGSLQREDKRWPDRELVLDQLNALSGRGPLAQFKSDAPSEVINVLQAILREALVYDASKRRATQRRGPADTTARPQTGI